MSMRKIDLTSFQVATSETARQINRRIALNFIRRHNPMSRADLARRSGFQRSTVSAIVDQLRRRRDHRAGRQHRRLGGGTAISAVTECDLFLTFTTEVLRQVSHAFEEDLAVPLPTYCLAMARFSRSSGLMK